jgi:hypothetical protein
MVFDVAGGFQASEYPCVLQVSKTPQVVRIHLPVPMWGRVRQPMLHMFFWPICVRADKHILAAAWILPTRRLRRSYLSDSGLPLR